MLLLWMKRLITYSLTSLLENRRNMIFVVWYYLSNSSIDVKNVIFVLPASFTASGLCESLEY